ncbi:hypothetical protein KUCAC02_004419, partial [Chaenocephalus aceratus]
SQDTLCPKMEVCQTPFVTPPFLHPSITSFLFPLIDATTDDVGQQQTPSFHGNLHHPFPPCPPLPSLNHPPCHSCLSWSLPLCLFFVHLLPPHAKKQPGTGT